jgi:hypothetical protein
MVQRFTYNFIDISFLPDDMKNSYPDLIGKRAGQIYAEASE